MSTFRALGGILFGPPTFLDSRDLIALTISVLLGRLVLMSRSLLGGGMTGETDGDGRLSVSLKHSAHRALCCSSPRMMFPSLPFTGRLGLLFLMESVLVISYRRFMFRSQLLDVRFFASQFVSLVGFSSSTVLVICVSQLGLACC